MLKQAEVVREEVLITSDQDVINQKLSDGTYRIKLAVPLTTMEMGQPRDGDHLDIAYGHTMICYVLAKLDIVED